MNVLLWVLQILLAVWNLIGGIFLIGNYHAVARDGLYIRCLPFLDSAGCTSAVLLAIGLVLPKMRKLNLISAACLAAISLACVALYTSYAGFPGMLWGVIPAVLASFVAYKRMAKS